MVHQVAGHRTRLLDIDAERHKLEEEAKSLTTSVLPDWKDVQPDGIKVSEISGGITNLLWLLTPDRSSKLQPVVLRVFGKQTDKIIDRDREAKILPALNAAGFGAQVLATFSNGRLEEYLPMRALKPQEMTAKPMAKQIAKRLKEFHSMRDVDVPKEPELFSVVASWLEQAKKLIFSGDSAKAEAHQGIQFDEWQKEFTEVRGLIEQAQPSSSFAHNDLLSGNILVPQEGADSAVNDGIQFIDFEYSSTTYRMYDIANHFCEYAGFECDYSRFPEADHVKFFVREYLEHGSSSSVAKYSPIDFDYMKYGQSRWAEYYKRKEEFLKVAESLQSQ